MNETIVEINFKTPRVINDTISAATKKGLEMFAKVPAMNHWVRVYGARWSEVGAGEPKDTIILKGMNENYCFTKDTILMQKTADRLNEGPEDAAVAQ